MIEARSDEVKLFAALPVSRSSVDRAVPEFNYGRTVLIGVGLLDGNLVVSDLCDGMSRTDLHGR